MKNLPFGANLFVYGAVVMVLLIMLAGIEDMTPELLAFLLVEIGLVILIFYVNLNQDWGEAPA